MTATFALSSKQMMVLFSFNIHAQDNKTHDAVIQDLRETLDWIKFKIETLSSASGRGYEASYDISSLKLYVAAKPTKESVVGLESCAIPIAELQFVADGYIFTSSNSIRTQQNMSDGSVYTTFRNSFWISGFSGEPEYDITNRMTKAVEHASTLAKRIRGWSAQKEKF